MVQVGSDRFDVGAVEGGHFRQNGAKARAVRSGKKLFNISRFTEFLHCLLDAAQLHSDTRALHSGGELQQ